MEGLDEEHDTEGEIETFYDMVLDLEDSSVEDNAHHEYHEDHNEFSDADAEEP